MVSLSPLGYRNLNPAKSLSQALDDDEKRVLVAVALNQTPGGALLSR